jgi:hypothetical protein
MKKMRFIAAVGMLAFVMTVAAGIFMQRLHAAPASDISTFESELAR